MKKYFIAAMLTAAAASPSFAASVHHRHVAQPGRAVATADRMAFESYAMAPTGYVVVQNGKVLGADPDPFIREQLMREGNPGDYAGN
ncbi:MAG TPA: hypothetical protein VNR39_06790 [Pseudolabrys sp.]|nr:hypothetical protein [Pseudolabrys sp.]